jgi:predicted 3-demethylubiquinone-9 3-methyltransferase (glyoxalase superfamily)
VQTVQITPCLWFDDQAEQAAEFYTTIFDNSRVVSTTCYTDAGQEIHGKESGAVMAVAFELDGQPFTGLNGGPMFQFSEAISFQINCRSQDEVDYYWERLSAGGDKAAQQCGWLKDKFGVSWQVVPTALLEMMNDPDTGKVARVTEAMLQMKKIDIGELKQAYDG